jgi:hypothetical protein
MNSMAGLNTGENLLTKDDMEEGEDSPKKSLAESVEEKKPEEKKP